MEYSCSCLARQGSLLYIAKKVLCRLSFREPLMYLITAATELEMKACCQYLNGTRGIRTLITGVGPVETAIRLTRYLSSCDDTVRLVINVGIAGAYVTPRNSARILDLCLAEKEYLGDFGICYDDRVEPFDAVGADTRREFLLDRRVLKQACCTLEQHQWPYRTGTFVTVNGVSATARRGQMLADRYHGLCENMEGAAAARVCEEFSLPMLEMRCVSNLVEERNRKNWKIREAATLCGKAAAAVVQGGFDEQ